MLASKFLGNSRALLTRKVWEAMKAGETTRRRHVAAVPARVKLSFAEKAAYAAILSASMWIIPAWVLYHLPDYQKENRNEYTGR